MTICLKSNFMLTCEERGDCIKIHHDMIEKYGPSEGWHERLLCNLSVLPGAIGGLPHVRFSGRILAPLNEKELAIVLMCGWNHGGGTLYLQGNGSFTAKFFT